MNSQVEFRAQISRFLSRNHAKKEKKGEMKKKKLTPHSHTLTHTSTTINHAFKVHGRK